MIQDCICTHSVLTFYYCSFLIKIKWKWNENEDAAADNIFILSVDGTHCRIKEPKKTPSGQWYSHKLNKPGVSYEIALDLKKSQISWTNGPFPAAKHDISIYKQENSGLKWQIPDGKKVIADRGYRGETNKELCTPNIFDDDKTKLFKRRARARHESVNKKIKDFDILENRFRHSVKKHKSVFEAVVVIVQMDMDNGLELFAI
jgi:hypothetical protein